MELFSLSLFYPVDNLRKKNSSRINLTFEKNLERLQIYELIHLRKHFGMKN